ncbi:MULTISPECIES: hypothetical protein [Streptococcus]|nr:MULTISPECIES: hypothetical protein [Streptococcus]
MYFTKEREVPFMVSRELLENLVKGKSLTQSGGKAKLETSCIYLGAESRTHFPNLKDSFGKTIKDPKSGNAMKSDESDGDTYTFSEIGTSKMVKVVYASGLMLEVGTLYNVVGLGYDMRNSNMLLIDEDSSIEAIAEEV